MLITRELAAAAFSVLVVAVCLNGCATGPKTRPFAGMDPPAPEIRNSMANSSESQPPAKGEAVVPAPSAPDKGKPEPKK